MPEPAVIDRSRHARRRAGGLVAALVVLGTVAFVAAPEASAASTYLTATFRFNADSGASSNVNLVGFENVTNRGDGTFTARPAIPGGNYTVAFPDPPGPLTSHFEFSAPTGMAGTLDAAGRTATYDLGLTLTANAGPSPSPGAYRYRYYLTMHMTGSYDPATGRVDLTSTSVVPGTTDRPCGCGDEDQYWIFNIFYAGKATVRFQFTVPPSANPVSTTTTTSTTTTVPAGAPAAPLLVNALPGNGSAKVQWYPATPNGAPVTGHRVTTYLNGVAQGTQAFVTSANAAVVTGLTNGTAYTFKVAAVNSFGVGGLSAASAPIVVGTPAAPILAVAYPGNGTARVNWWGTVADNGSPITGYRITPFIGGQAQPAQEFATPNNNQIVTGLTNGTTYTFRVAAINGRGAGAPSTATAPITIGTPVAPPPPTVVAGVQQATVTWKAAVDNGSPVTGYVLTPVKAGVPQAAVNVPANALSRTVTGLATGASYTFTVAAVNARGTGPASNPSAAATIG